MGAKQMFRYCAAKIKRQLFAYLRPHTRSQRPNRIDEWRRRVAWTWTASRSQLNTCYRTCGRSL